MKANELMIGDWVSDEYKLPMQIYRVEGEFAYADSGCSLYEFNKDYPPQPIPLTPEILEKNGWKAGERGEYRREPYKLFQTKKGWDFCYGFQGITDIRFVHELQNILRMLGCEGGFKV